MKINKGLLGCTAVALASAVCFYFLSTAPSVSNQWQGIEAQKSMTVHSAASDAVASKSAEIATTTPAVAIATAHLKQKAIELQAARDAEEADQGKLSKAQRIEEAIKDEQRRTLDPALGYVPKDRFGPALEFAKKRQDELLRTNFDTRGATLSKAKWKERGPTNVGGRVGTILVDANDPTKKTLFVGHCSGGLWKTTDITAARPVWKPINDFLQNLAVGGIVQDPKNPQIMYLGTGDPSADAVRGIGIFKSLDGGNTWTLLTSTAYKAAFQKTREIVITNDGSIYAACNTGVQKSTDGGATWVRVLDNEIWDLKYVAATNTLFATKTSTIWKSTLGNSGTWKNITTTATGFPTGWTRTEVTICESAPNVLYAVGANLGPNTAAYKSIDTGATWTLTGLPAGRLTDSQAWYDLDIAVDPTNPNRVFAGGLDLHFSIDGGNSWRQVSEWAPKSSPTYVHADQHYIHFEPGNGNVCYFGNDGGIFATRNSGKTAQPTIDDKNTGYNTTLFYYGAIHPTTYSNYFLGGAQDNGSNQMNTYDPGDAREVTGGDGFWVHIDQDEPNIQFTTLYDGEFFLSRDGGISFGDGIKTDGDFRTFGAYDDKENNLYAQSKSKSFVRYNVNTRLSEAVNLTSGSVGNPSCMAIDPNTPNRLYIANFSGSITRVDNAHVGTNIAGTFLTTPNTVAGGAGTISSIDVQEGDPNHILVCYSNYGLKNNILESKDGGKSWIGLEGTNQLPDVPVRWAIFDPSNGSRAMIATEVGVWTTDLLDGAATVWFPPLPGKGTPLVRTNHLEYRKSDKVVMAATWGRGIWSSSVFSDPKVDIKHATIGYEKGGISFLSNSLGADSFLWNFGDGNTDTTEQVIHAFDKKGEYDISLTINNGLKAEGRVKILPDRPLPYIPGAADYSGNFEGNTDQYGVYTESGSGWERGVSTFVGKNTSSTAFVIAPTKQFYDINSVSYLYLPNFNLGNKGIYEFSFWAKYNLHLGPDGFNVEYSKDRGLTWNQLGSNTDKGWYNYISDNNDFAFKKGTSYFTGVQTKIAKFSLNISNLSGPGFENMAFRFVFKSDGLGSHVGVAVDDVEITSYDGELVTKLIDNTAKFVDQTGTAIKVDWSTLPEYLCKKFEVEVSTNGKDFVTSGSVNAFGTTATRQNYAFTITATNKALYFVRIKVIAQDGTYFYSSIMVVSRDLEEEDIFNYYPNPFDRSIEMTFTGLINKKVTFELYDMIGRLVFTKEAGLENQIYYVLEVPEIAAGKYTLRVTFDEGATKVFPLIKANK